MFSCLVFIGSLRECNVTYSPIAHLYSATNRIASTSAVSLLTLARFTSAGHISPKYVRHEFVSRQNAESIVFVVVVVLSC